MTGGLPVTCPLSSSFRKKTIVLTKKKTDRKKETKTRTEDKGVMCSLLCGQVNEEMMGSILLFLKEIISDVGFSNVAFIYIP